MARLPHLKVFSIAAVHLLLLSICPVSSRIYRTNDAVVIEVDDILKPSNMVVQPLGRFARSNFGNRAPIPMTYAANPYMGFYSQQQSNFPFWPYPLYKPTSSLPDDEDVATTLPESRQQTIPCGVGPASPPQRSTPTVGIVGGTEAVPNSWPFVVGLRKNSGKVFCTGSIISPTRILTAAQCVNRASQLDILGMTVSLGMHNQGNNGSSENDAQQTRRITRVVYNPNYNDATITFDVAILTIEPPIIYSKAISPVCLPPFNNAADQLVGQDAAIMGWGLLTYGGNSSKVLQQATVQIITKAECNAQFEGGIFNQHICASAPGKDACKGDGGGPLVVQAQPDSNAWTQVGIASAGYGCATPGYSGVYTNVAYFRNWINTYMKN